MKRRFLAVLARSGLSEDAIDHWLGQAAEHGMDPICRSPGMLVLSSGLKAFAFDPAAHGLGGAVLGDVHFRHGPHDAFNGSPAEIARLAQVCREGKLGEQCWGSFLAIQQSDRNGPIAAWHSPFSALPIYYAVTADTILLSGDAALLNGFLDRPADIDWRGIAMQLAVDNFAFSRTGLDGIGELRCGEVLEWDRSTAPAVRKFWDPWPFAAENAAFQEEGPALEIVERELVRCTITRTRGLAAPMLDLSGGLDSSILAAIIAKHGLEVQAVNMFSPATEGDERGFASAVADHLGIVLAECCPQADRIDIRRCASPRLARPHARSFVQEVDRQTLDAFPNATAFINGGGGDAVLCHLQSSGPAADVLRSRGRTPGFVRTVHDVAEAAQVSFWTASRKALAKAMRRPAGPALLPNTTFLARDALVLPAADDLPWPSPPKGMLPGKLEQIRGIYSCCFNMQGFARSGDIEGIFPMLSQPLVEACLKVPTWMWLANGHDRCLARKIAAEWLPPNVAWRRSKGGLGQLQRDVYRLNKTAIREMLLEGALQSHGILDRAAMERQLAPAGELTSEHFPALLRLCDFEAWLQTWR